MCSKLPSATNKYLSQKTFVSSLSNKIPCFRKERARQKEQKSVGTASFDSFVSNFPYVNKSRQDRTLRNPFHTAFPPPPSAWPAPTSSGAEPGAASRVLTRTLRNPLWCAIVVVCCCCHAPRFFLSSLATCVFVGLFMGHHHELCHVLCNVSTAAPNESVRITVIRGAKK